MSSSSATTTTTETSRPYTTSFPSSSPPNSSTLTSTAPSSSATQSWSPATVRHTLALTAVIAAPVIILLPPRKIDIYTFAAGSLGIFGANQLVQERYGGKGIMGVAGDKLGFNKTAPMTQPDRSSACALPSSSLVSESRVFDRDMAERRRERYASLAKTATRLRREGWGVGGDVRDSLQAARRQVEADARRYGWVVPMVESESESDGARGSQALARALSSGSGGWRGTLSGERPIPSSSSSSSSSLPEEEHREGGVRGMVRRVWMGDETADWKERRLAEEQKALDEGKGYSDLILDQIWEVWNWDRKKDDEGNWVPKDK